MVNFPADSEVRSIGMSIHPEPVFGMASLSLSTKELPDCWLVMVTGPMRAPEVAARFHADLPSMFSPG